MKLNVRVLAAVLLVLFTATEAWAAFCWQVSGGTVSGVGILAPVPGAGSYVPVVGEFRPAPPLPCQGHNAWPVHGIAKLVGNEALLGVSVYNEQGLSCPGTLVAEFRISLINLAGSGWVRTTDLFPSEFVTLTPIVCP